MSNATPSTSPTPPAPPTPPKSTSEPYVQQTDGSFRAVKLLPRRARDSLPRLCWAAPIDECVAAVPEYEHQPPAPVRRGGQTYEWVATMVQPPAPAMPVPVPVYVPRPVVQAAPREEVEDYYSDDEVHERHPEQQGGHEQSKDKRESLPAAAPVSASWSTSAAPTAPRRELILDEDYDAVEPQDDLMDMDFASAPSRLVPAPAMERTCRPGPCGYRSDDPPNEMMTVLAIVLAPASGCIAF